MKNYKYVSALLLTVIIFLSAFAGCSLTNPSSMIKDIENKLPGSEVINVEESKKCNTYTVKYKDIEFHVYNEIKKASIDALTESPQFSTDYFSQILETDNIKALLEEYDMSVEYVYRDSSPTFHPYAQNSAELRRIYDFIEELNECVYEYLPEEKFFDAEFKIDPQYQYKPDDASYHITIALESISTRRKTDWDYKYYSTLIDTKAKLDVNATEDEIKYSYSPDYFTNVDYESIPHRYIRNLYIDGKEFTSEKYDVKFIYRIKDGKYYAITGYGQKFSHNFGVEDHLHREIISHYYPDSRYNINAKTEITTYEINGNKYRMTSTDESKIPEFYKNNQPLNIETLRNIDGHTPGANYFVFINVEDWAELMEMKVEKIDTSGVYLSLK